MSQILEMSFGNLAHSGSFLKPNSFILKPVLFMVQEGKVTKFKMEEHSCNFTMGLVVSPNCILCLSVSPKCNLCLNMSNCIGLLFLYSTCTPLYNNKS